MSDSIATELVVLFVLVRVGLRELKERKVRLDRIYVMPAIFAVFAVLLVGLAIAARPEDTIVLVAGSVVAGAIGAAAGWWTAHYTTIRVVPERHVVFTRGSWATVAIWCAALGLRVLGRLAGREASFSPAVANAVMFVLLATLVAVVRHRILVKSRLAIARGTAAEIAAA